MVVGAFEDSVKDEEAGSVALWGWGLCDAGGWEVIVEICGAHGLMMGWEGGAGEKPVDLCGAKCISVGRCGLTLR
jgi:hypothetical protein